MKFTMKHEFHDRVSWFPAGAHSEKTDYVFVIESFH